MASTSRATFPPFEMSKIPQTELRQKWEKWIRGFQIHMEACEITDPKKKKIQLLSLGGFELQETYYDLAGEDEEPNADDPQDPYEEVKQILSDYFAPKQHQVFERYLFCSLKPTEGETMNQFGQRALNHAVKCQFGTSEQEARENRVIDLIISFAPTELREKLLYKKDLTLDLALKMCKAFEAIRYQAQQLAPNAENTSAGFVNKTYERGDCQRCGGAQHRNVTDCPAYGKACDKCGFTGHFSKQCRTRPGRYKSEDSRKRRHSFRTGQKSEKRQKTYRIEMEPTEKSDSEEELKVYGIQTCEELVTVRVGEVAIQMFIDSGSACNMIDEKTWCYLKAQGAKMQELSLPTKKKFIGYGRNPLKVLAVFKADMILKDRTSSSVADAHFYVIQQGQQPLLGSRSAKSLGVLQIGIKGDHVVNHIQNLTPAQFPRIKGVKLTLPIDRDVTPVQQPLRRVPLALLKQIDEKLDELLAQGIIEKVQDYSPWISPMVPVIKKNGELRLCIDMRRANAAIKREKHPLPTIDSLLSQLNGAKYFSLLDIRQAFFQCELDENSREITTFNTHRGLFRFTRLIFGVSCAPESFQQV